jgi:triosephosphate isomerase
MHKLIADAAQLALDLKPRVVNSRHCDIVVAPTFTALKTVNDRLEGSNIKTAGQDLCDHAGQGAYTGEISGEMLRDLGCSYVIIGHSERRQFYHETNESVNLKIRAALTADLRPIVCVGENLAERDRGEMEEVVGRQLRESLAGLTANELSLILIAYEPVWAIGTGRTATPDTAEKMHRFIRSVLATGWGEPASIEMPILYGGSVKPDNIATLMNEPDIDGALVGGASLVAESFAQIVNYK